MNTSSDGHSSSPNDSWIRLHGGLLAVPAVFWLLIFFLLPLAIVVMISFVENGPRGRLIYDWTLENYHYVNDTYKPVLIDSLKTAFYTSLICFVMGYPLAFFISTRRNRITRNISLFLVILPFWTNFLVRTYAWRVLLGNNGIATNFLEDTLGLRNQLEFLGYLARVNILGQDASFIPLNKPPQLIFTKTAVLLGMVYGFLPFMVLPIYASVERFNFRLVEAAHDLGANDWRAFWRIIFPLTLPGVIAGWILVFIPSVGAFVTPDLLGGTKGVMIGNLIQRDFQRRNWPRGAAASLALMAIVAIGLLLYMILLERQQKSSRSSSGKKSRFSLIAHTWASLKEAINRPLMLIGDKFFDTLTNLQRRFSPSQKTIIRRDLALRKIGSFGLWLNPIICYTFLWVPILVLVFFSFNDSNSMATFRGFTTRWYTNIFNNTVGSEERFSTALMLDALKNSLFIGITATVIATIFGTMVAISLVRSNFFGKKALSAGLYLPVAIPEITQAISLSLFFNILFDFLQNGWLISHIDLFRVIYFKPDTIIPGGWAIVDYLQCLWLAFTDHQISLNLSLGYTTIIIGHVAFNISFITVVIQARLVDMNPHMEEAAYDLGASVWRTFRRVTLPLLMPGILAGALLAFTLSLDDFVVTFFTSGVGTTTLPVFVYGLLKLTITPEINAISTLMIIVSTILVGLSLALQGRNAANGS